MLRLLSPCTQQYLPMASSLLTLLEALRKYQRIARKKRMIRGSGIKMYGLAAEAITRMAMNGSSSCRTTNTYKTACKLVNRVGMHPSVEKKERTIKYSKKAFGNKSSRNPTSLENLFNTRPNQNTNLKELACTMQHRLTTRICVKEKYWNSENGLKHSVMQNPGSSVADQIESNSLY